MTSLDGEMANRFLRACRGSRYDDVFHTLIYTGLRRSEALALKWENVDLEGQTLRVVDGLHRLRGMGLTLLPVKTAKSRRQIDITPEVVDRLRGIRGGQLVSQARLGPAWQTLALCSHDLTADLPTLTT